MYTQAFYPLSAITDYAMIRLNIFYRLLYPTDN